MNGIEELLRWLHYGHMLGLLRSFQIQSCPMWCSGSSLLTVSLQGLVRRCFRSVFRDGCRSDQAVISSSHPVLLVPWLENQVLCRSNQSSDIPTMPAFHSFSVQQVLNPQHSTTQMFCIGDSTNAHAILNSDFLVSSDISMCLSWHIECSVFQDSGGHQSFQISLLSVQHYFLQLTSILSCASKLQSVTLWFGDLWV